MNDKNPENYASWVVIIIHNVGNDDVKLKNLEVTWGMLHADGNRDEEVSPDKYEGCIIGPDKKLQLNGHQRMNSPSGTTGKFDLCDANDGDKVIRRFYWDCPRFAQPNTWTVSGSNSQWTVEDKGANLEGALGVITVDVMKEGN
ncbi:Ostreolysin A6 [Paramarasmius palmivorus]|uniref:Ostreolysin A6 n=1 Tax=Paramarasmius palmivorus TaxID=297713 RepID=A0AAW0BCI7_9AGAR